MTTQQHNQLVKRLHLITVILGATLALVSYLILLNIRTPEVDARRYTTNCYVYPNGSFSGDWFRSAQLTGIAYMNGAQVASFAISASVQSGRYYYFSGVTVPVTSPGTYTLKVKDGKKIISCTGSFTR